MILLLFALGYGAKALSLIENLLNQMSRSGSAKRELDKEIKKNPRYYPNWTAKARRSNGQYKISR